MTDYDSVARVYARYRGIQSGVLRALVELNLNTGARVLEVGCGTANHLRALRAETGCAAWGVDPSVGMLGQIRSGDDIHLAVGLAEALPYADASFDLLFNVDVIHHLRDLDAAFGEMARLLRPGGVLLTATDSEETIRARDVLSAYFPETVAHELARYPSAARLTSAHVRRGLEIAGAFVAEHTYVITDAAPFRARAYSCLHLISDGALAAGAARLEADLPLTAVSRNAVIVARRQA